MSWQVQRECMDIGDYELVVEKQKQGWECEQRRESWKWLVARHGSVVASGYIHDAEQAKALAKANVPGI